VGEEAVVVDLAAVAAALVDLVAVAVAAAVQAATGKKYTHKNTFKNHRIKTQSHEKNNLSCRNHCSSFYNKCTSTQTPCGNKI
jgi:hypothetical protein